jgi:hypothetical protein
MVRSYRWFVLAAATLATLAASSRTFAQGEEPCSVSYQGQVTVNGSPFNGTGQFKFVIYDEAQVASLWSNDGTSQNGGQPTTAVSLPVTNGLFDVGLGSGSMLALCGAAIVNAESPVLRIWVNTGSGFEQLPDQALRSAPWALSSTYARNSAGPFTATGQIWSTSGGFRFPDGSVQTTAAVGGGGGGTLDQAYDFGGAGAGRTITADAGAVNLLGTGGLTSSGPVAVGTVAPEARLGVENAGSNDTTKLLNLSENEDPEFYIESGFLGTGPTGNFLKMQTFWGNNAMTWRGDGKVGIGVTAPFGRLTVEHGGTGAFDPTAAFRNTNATSGIALYAEAVGSDAAMVVNNAGTGDIQRGFNGGGSPVFRVDHAGKSISTGLQVTTGPLIVDTSSRIRMNGAFGSGVGGAPLYVENTTSNGIAMWGKVTSTDATAVLEQNGTGALLRAFQNGSLKFEVRNSGRVVTTALEITGGGDLAEPFTVSEGERAAAPGTVLVIDEAHPGQLTTSRAAYDRRVAGVVSGANGLEPGISLTPTAHQKGGVHVALSGRVYAKADASGGAIRPGDLLTTSEVPGHVMKASDAARTPGAVIGKAMTALEKGRGLVLVLVSLQ